MSISSMYTRNAAQGVIGTLGDLVGFDTTSRNGNLDLIGYIEDRLADVGAEVARIASDDGRKANMLARIGPACAKGVCLSAHSDVVPVDGQIWTTDPFTLHERDGRLFGRGTADMKTFLAGSIELACWLGQTTARRPLYLAVSYDEEVGCLGAPSMIEKLASIAIKPAVIVGEPTGMLPVGAHKGTTSFHVTVVGREAHSSLIHLGVSANEIAVRLMVVLLRIAQTLEHGADMASPFEAGHSTLTIGTISGGTATNILSGRCDFSFDLRFIPGDDPNTILAPFFEEVEREDRALRARYASAGITVAQPYSVPAFDYEADGSAAALVLGMTRSNDVPSAVAFCSESGQFQQAGFSTIICGPGSIEQAHQPDEYIDLDQITRFVTFLERLGSHLAADSEDVSLSANR